MKFKKGETVAVTFGPKKFAGKFVEEITLGIPGVVHGIVKIGKYGSVCVNVSLIKKRAVL